MVGSHPCPPTPIPAVHSHLGMFLGAVPVLSLTPRQRRRCPGLPARVSQEQAEKGLHHGEVVSAVCPAIPGIGVLGPPNQGVGAELDPTG